MSDCSTALQEFSAPPLVSVVIPAYNAERFIARTLTSVLTQTYCPIEVIVVDDGSNDRSAEIVRAVVQTDDRIRLLQQPNRGVAAARNLGIQDARGEFIAPLDADDIWYPTNIARQVQCFLQYGSDVGLVYSWSVDIDENDIPTGNIRASRIQGRVFTTLLLHDFIANASSVLIRRNCLEKVGGYDISLRERNGQGGEDWDIYLRIAEHYEFRVVPEVLVGYRKLADSMSRDFSQMARSRQLIWQSIRQKYPHIPITVERLSNSSFYLHLANQCYETHQDRAIVYWLLQALRTNPIMSWFRLRTYRLLALAFFRLSCSRAKQGQGVLAAKRMSSGHDRISDSGHKIDMLSHLGGEQRRTLNVKSIAERLLHWFAQAILGSPCRWQKKRLL